MRRKTAIFVWFLLGISLIVSPAFGQATPKKKNSRPRSNSEKENLHKTSLQKEDPVYFYQFTQPKFLVSKVVIEHDENGLGRLIFRKKNFEEDVVEPLALSHTTMERLKGIWTKLKFLKGGKNYQSKLDYPHLGTMRFRVKKEGAERSTEFNWTDNMDARSLANEYRKIGNQFIWMFDIGVALVNQPLEAPRIMNGLESYLGRNAISDPQQMIPFLQKLSDNERIPLIARHHAERLVKKIESSKKKIGLPKKKTD